MSQGHLNKENVQTAHKHTKRYPIWYTIREFQIKAKGYDYIPIKLPEIPQIYNNKFNQRCRVKKTHSLMVRVQNVIATVGVKFTKLNLFYYIIQQLVFAQMCRNFMFTQKHSIDAYSNFIHYFSNFKLSKCPLTCEWINKLSYTPTIEYGFRARKKWAGMAWNKNGRNLNIY